MKTRPQTGTTMTTSYRTGPSRFGWRCRRRCGRLMCVYLTRLLSTFLFTFYFRRDFSAGGDLSFSLAPQLRCTAFLLSFYLSFGGHAHSLHVRWTRAFSFLFSLTRALVGRFKIFSTIYSEKCRSVFRHFSVKKEVKILDIFHHFLPFF
ncbi:hypothetical protein B0H16DRAFT_221227 [Mycena metata]|uniref:Transmembrane protein n=1 Tax=Mycena metata TaxID=1033252 RepID=A0AAD7HY96_9AGAR|nr:hypothetical protein B0H16DRAFT_221227 [Mycena metata]